MKKLLFIYLLIALNAAGQSDTDTVFNSMEKALLTPESVKSLNLADDSLKIIPVEILKLLNLEKIDLSLNPGLDLRQAFDILKQIKNLKTLYLTGDKIAKLPKNIALLLNLEELCLDDNKLNKFPEPVKKLSHLKYLRLFSNKIQRIDFNNDELQELISIDLCYNKFTVFPVQLSTIKNLKKITIRNNQIKYIPKAIKKFKNIEDINLESNNLSALPKQLSSLAHLQKLTLSKNKLTASSLNPVYKISTLQLLDIDENAINFISPKIGQLKSLVDLSICDNPITDLPGELAGLVNIQQLGLGDLHKLNWEHAFLIMEKMRNLKRVGMYTMQLNKMPGGFEKLQQVDTFWLTYNSFDEKEKDRIKAIVPKAKIDFY